MRDFGKDRELLEQWLAKDLISLPRVEQAVRAALDRIAELEQQVENLTFERDQARKDMAEFRDANNACWEKRLDEYRLIAKTSLSLAESFKEDTAKLKEELKRVTDATDRTP